MENLSSKLFLLYIPTRSSDNLCFDTINNNDGIFKENTGVAVKDNSKLRMAFYGGLSSITPFFYLLRNYHFKIILFCFFKGFIENIEFPTILNELLKLVIILFKNKAENQQEASKIGFFQVIGQLLCELKFNFINHETLEFLADIKNLLIDQKLLDQVK